MKILALIGGSGFSRWPDLTVLDNKTLATPYGAPSAPYLIGHSQGQLVVFLARHGDPHRIPPHQINYRANLWGLRELGVTHVIALAAVGGISPTMYPASLAVPDQLIDYTHGRTQTFFEGDLDHVTHIDFSFPYSAVLRQSLLRAAQQGGIAIHDGGVYGCTQGPRLETAAEIRRMAHDGCDMVGMTGMPEAVLARELGLDYAALAVVANWAAGITDSEISLAEIEATLQQGMADARCVLARLIADWEAA